MMKKFLGISLFAGKEVSSLEKAKEMAAAKSKPVLVDLFNPF